MLEKLTRKKVLKQDDTRPTNIEQLIEKYSLEELWNKIDEIIDYSNTGINIDTVYPIGSIYMSVNSTNPGSLFGGTWTAWGSGRVPVGIDTNDTDFDTVEETGGEKTHTLVSNELPKITPTFNQTISKAPYGMSTGSAYSEGIYTAGVGTNLTINEIGGDQAHNNLQPYITCYMWKRIS